MSFVQITGKFCPPSEIFLIFYDVRKLSETTPQQSCPLAVSCPWNAQQVENIHQLHIYTRYS